MREDPNTKIGGYAIRLCGTHLDRVGYQIGIARKSNDPDSIHDLRVSIHRFLTGLREFRQFFPKKEIKKIRKRLDAVMHLSSAVRDRDIALGLGRSAGISTDSVLLQRISEQRDDAVRDLGTNLKRIHRRDVTSKWRDQLSL